MFRWAARQAARPVELTNLATWSRVRCRGHCLPTISQERQVLLIDACLKGDATGCKREAVRQALACDCERAPLFGLQRGTAVLGDRKIVGGGELSRKRLERMRRRRFPPRERVVAGLGVGG